MNRISFGLMLGRCSIIVALISLALILAAFFGGSHVIPTIPALLSIGGIAAALVGVYLAKDSNEIREGTMVLSWLAEFLFKLVICIIGIAAFIIAIMNYGETLNEAYIPLVFAGIAIFLFGVRLLRETRT